MSKINSGKALVLAAIAVTSLASLTLPLTASAQGFAVYTYSTYSSGHRHGDDNGRGYRGGHDRYDTDVYRGDARRDRNGYSYGRQVARSGWWDNDGCWHAQDGRWYDREHRWHDRDDDSWRHHDHDRRHHRDRDDDDWDEW